MRIVTLMDNLRNCGLAERNCCFVATCEVSRSSRLREEVMPLGLFDDGCTSLHGFDAAQVS